MHYIYYHHDNNPLSIISILQKKGLRLNYDDFPKATWGVHGRDKIWTRDSLLCRFVKNFIYLIYLKNSILFSSRIASQSGLHNIINPQKQLNTVTRKSLARASTNIKYYLMSGLSNTKSGHIK